MQGNLNRCRFQARRCRDQFKPRRTKPRRMRRVRRRNAMRARDLDARQIDHERIKRRPRSAGRDFLCGQFPCGQARLQRSDEGFGGIWRFGAGEWKHARGLRPALPASSAAPDVNARARPGRAAPSPCGNRRGFAGVQRTVPAHVPARPRRSRARAPRPA